MITDRTKLHDTNYC